MTNSKRISENVKRFVDHYIDNVGQLEILLLLRESSHRHWTAEALSEHLRSSNMATERQLSELYSRGLIERHDKSPLEFSYGPKSEDLKAVVEELASIYGTWKTAIIMMIYEKPVKRLRDLADAFNLKKDEE